MKRTLTAALLIMLLLCSCSGKKTDFDESRAFAYVGAGEMTVINTLVKSNGFFVEDVFVANSLSYDSEKAIKTENGTYAPVNPDIFSDYSDFERKIRSTYTESASEELLSNNKYANIDGKLYFNMDYETDTTEKYMLDWSNASAEATIDTNGKYEISAKIKGSAGISKTVVLYAINENGNIRLDNLYS